MKTYTNGAYYDNALFSRGLISYQMLRFPEALGDFERMVEDFGTSRFAEQAYYMRGWCYYMMGRDREALGVCTNFLDQFPDSLWAPEVLFWIGEYEYNHGSYEKAEDRFVRLANEYGTDRLADAALFWAGRAASKLKEYRRAIEHFGRLAKEYPGSPKLPEARDYQGDAVAELGEFPAAILIFEEIITQYRTHAVVNLAWLRKGDCQFTLGAKDPKRFTEAMDSYREVRSSSTATLEQKIQAEYKIGRCLEKAGKPVEAFDQYYTRVVCQYFNDQAAGLERGGQSEVWFTRAAFNAADLMEAQKNWRQSVRILQRVIQANVPAAKDARERIDRIRAEHWLFY